MKVAELIEYLQEQDPTAEVHFAYNYGDHWRTQVAPKVESVELCAVAYSDYHCMPKIVDSNPDDYDEDIPDGQETGMVVVLS